MIEHSPKILAREEKAPTTTTTTTTTMLTDWESVTSDSNDIQLTDDSAYNVDGYLIDADRSEVLVRFPCQRQDCN